MYTIHDLPRYHAILSFRTEKSKQDPHSHLTYIEHEVYSAGSHLQRNFSHLCTSLNIIAEFDTALFIHIMWGEGGIAAVCPDFPASRPTYTP